jgi:cyclomaltodextrinase / maltogenic alpha-amylase / neopullulanase
MSNPSTPGWSRHVIGYQCFVDSFASGASSIEEKASLYSAPVYNQQPRRLNWTEEFSDYSYGYSFYGGDLGGIINAIDRYLADFGVDMLYLTPLFKAESNHKYDTLDYLCIDPQFGDAAVFAKLVETCRSRNIKLILDGVFNHTSYHHEWYLKALRGEQPYADYYKKDANGRFLTWNGVETLVLLNHDHPDVQNFFYGLQKSVVTHWLDQGADGWRLDVAERLGAQVIQKIKSCITNNFADKILYGEVIETYGRDWLGNELLDGAMNYVFLGTTVNFLTDKINGETYLYELDKMYKEYPNEQLYQCWNIISTHDTNRMIYEVDGNENLFKIAVTLQFTYPGVPMIYNGDELGIMPGQKDNNNRQGLDWTRVDLVKLKAQGHWRSMQAMDWRRVNQYSSFYYFYKHLVWLRRNYPVLVEGEFIPAYAYDSVVAYFRVLGPRYALIMVNKAETREIQLVVPEEIRKSKPILTGVHGPLSKIEFSDRVVSIEVRAQNAYILVN